MRRKTGLLSAKPPRKRGAEYVRPGKSADYAGVQRLQLWLKVLGVLILLFGTVCAGYALVHYGIPAIKNAVLVSSAPVSSAGSSAVQEDEPTDSTPPLDSHGLPLYADDFCLQIVSAQQPWTGQTGNLVSYREILLDERVLPALQAMEEAAAEQGVLWWYQLGFVTAEEQQQRYLTKAEQLAGEGMSGILARSMAEKQVPQQGHTDLHTGLSFLLVQSAAGQQEEIRRWLYTHAAEYGFILRYPQGDAATTGVEGEPPVFRYVGTEHAMQMRYLSLCLEDYCVYMGRR